MDTNVCGMNHLDRDVLLPPRKRLLAGLKIQNSDPQSHQISPPSMSDEVDTQLKDKLNHHLSSNTSSPQEIVESSRLAAIAAMNAAKAARAVAEEKAVIAVKAVAAAKSAIELSASVSEETTSTESKDKHSQKSKLKKHMPVQILYNKHQEVGTSPTDELACKLHRDINSSLRISKNSFSSNLKNHKHKRMKLLPPFEKGRIANGGMAFDGNVQSNCSINPESGEVNSERCSLDADAVKVDGKRAQFCNGIQLKPGNGEAGSSQSRERIHEIAEDTSPGRRKRGRVKLKKLSLSICAIRDQASPSKGNKRSTVTQDDETGKSTAGNISLFPIDISIDKGGCRGFINMDMPRLQGTSMRPTK